LIARVKLSGTWPPLLVIHDTSYDQAGAPVILGHHRFKTRDARYPHEVR
jgi:hypothetical protein